MTARPAWTPADISPAKARVCQWPSDEPCDSDRLAGKPYCSFHDAVAHGRAKAAPGQSLVARVAAEIEAFQANPKLGKQDRANVTRHIAGTASKGKRVAAAAGRRFTDPPKGDGQADKLPRGHAALATPGTRYPKSVVAPKPQDRILKSGKHNRKIGETVTVGRWRGAPIYTLTLEERATCPTSCHFWRGCYGNGMHWSKRWDLSERSSLKQLAREVQALDAAHHSTGFVVRLHVLGDFFSLFYVRFWAACLDDFDGLRIFGFTARDPRNDIVGAAIRRLRSVYPDRFVVRFSRLHPVDGELEALPWIGDAIDLQPGAGFLCPAQVRDDKCCATCAACWQSKQNVHFRPHGK